jgi:predicted Zn-dependent protease
MRSTSFIQTVINIVLIGLVVFTLQACKSTSLKVGNLDIGKLVNQGVKVFDANNIDEAQEIQLGINMSAVLLGIRPLVQSESINRYVNQVGMWLAQNSERPNLPWHFGVIDSTAINAFAAPGGYIFITSAMIKQLDNEAQLAAVLAHEIIHVTQLHHLNAIKNGTLREAITESLFVSADAYQSYTSANNQDKQYSAWAKKVTGAAQSLYSKGLDRGDEFQADKLGILLLAKSGYDAYAFVDNLQLLASISADDSALALMYKTHPTPDQRLEAMKGQLDTLHSNGKLLSERFQSIMQ